LPQASKSKKCAKCNLHFSIKYKFCTECGFELISSNSCPNCQNQITKNSKFCSECGESLRETKTDFVSDSWEETPDSDVTKSKEQEYLTVGYVLSGVVFVIVVILIITSLSSNGSSTTYNNDPSSFMNNRYYDPNTGTWYFLP